VATIPFELSNYATQASSLTGLNKSVILAQWISENGWKVPTGYNFGNIMKPGTHTLETYSSGSAGVQAYANFLKNNSNYNGVMATAGSTPESQLKAIVASPWDAGHYGGDGSLLTNVYNSVTGASIVPGSFAPTTTSATTGSGTPGALNFLSMGTDKIISGFWLVVGVVVVFFGVYLLTNPMAGITDALSKLGGGKVDVD